MKKIAVVGSGTMGRGIAQVIAQANYQVYLCDTSKDIVDQSMKLVHDSLKKAVLKKKITEEDTNRILLNIKPTAIDLINEKSEYINALRDIDLVVEAITEDLKVKKSFYHDLDIHCHEKSIFATNTSALSVSELASCTKRPDRVIGMHFFNPATTMKLIEITSGSETSKATNLTIKLFCETLGKVPVNVVESPGFIVNRMLVPLINEAAFMYMEGIASAEDIDTAMCLGAGHPLGPLSLADMIGLDVCLAVMETLFNEFGDSKYRPCPLLKKMVRANQLGQKTGNGFYSYISDK